MISAPTWHAEAGASSKVNVTNGCALPMAKVLLWIFLARKRDALPESLAANDKSSRPVLGRAKSAAE
jgi:hypothetical protein